MKKEEIERKVRAGKSLAWADLSNSDLRGSNLRGSDLRGSNLSGSDLSEADLSEADLNEADLSGSDLSEADLKNACLKWADLTGTILDGANGILQFNKLGGRTCYAVQHDHTYMVLAGCFWGTLDKFEKQAIANYGDDEMESYKAQIAYIRSMQLK